MMAQAVPISAALKDIGGHLRLHWLVHSTAAIVLN